MRRVRSSGGTKARTSITAGHVSQNGQLLLQERDDVRGRGRGGWRGGRPITGLESPPPDARPASCPPPSARPRARSLLHRQLHRHLHPRYAERLLPLPRNQEMGCRDVSRGGVTPRCQKSARERERKRQRQTDRDRDGLAGLPRGGADVVEGGGGPRTRRGDGPRCSW